MTTLTMGYMRGHFVVTAVDSINRAAKRDWCTEHHPGSPIRKSAPTRPSERPSRRRRNWCELRNETAAVEVILLAAVGPS